MNMPFRFGILVSFGTLALLFNAWPLLAELGRVKAICGTIVLSGLLAWLCQRLDLKAFQVYFLAICGLTVIFGGITLAYAYVPVWLLITICAALLIVYLTIHFVRDEGRKQTRAEMGLCEQCGYDLRESFECCPECGADIPAELARRRRLAEHFRTKRAGSNQASDPS